MNFSGSTGIAFGVHARRRFDQFIQRWRAVAAGLPDRRTGDNCFHDLADIATSPLAVFFTQCPSFLSFQQNMEKASGRNNARSLFQIGRIPSDNHIRQTLDPIAPSHLFSLFDDLHRAFDQTGLLSAMRAVANTRLIAVKLLATEAKIVLQKAQCSPSFNGMPASADARFISVPVFAVLAAAAGIHTLSTSDFASLSSGLSPPAV